MQFHPEGIPANEQFHITEVTSVALCETLEHYIYNNKVEIKWPNDIYVGIGIGLNVNQTEFRSDAPNPVSLYQLTGKETDKEELLDRFLKAFEAAWLRNITDLTYRERLFRKGKPYLYKDETTCFTASLIDVEADGRLVLQDETGRQRRYAFKEVEFVI